MYKAVVLRNPDDPMQWCREGDGKVISGSGFSKDELKFIIPNAVCESGFEAATAFTEVITNATTTAATNITNFMNSTAANLQDNDQENDVYNITHLVLVGLGVAVAVAAVGIPTIYCAVHSICKKLRNNDTELDVAFYSAEFDNVVLHNALAGESGAPDVDHSNAD